MQHYDAHNHQRTFRIILATAATARNIQLIVETIIASLMDMAFTLNTMLKARRRSTISIYSSVLSVHV